MTVELKDWCLMEVPGPHVRWVDSVGGLNGHNSLGQGSEPLKCYGVEKKIHIEVMEVKTRVVKIDMTGGDQL